MDSSERLSAGGASGARGYDAGVLSGDSGGIAKVEWRHDLPQLGAGRWQSGVFVDAAWMKINQRRWPKTNSPPLAEEINHDALKSAGVALAWAHRQG